MSRDIRFRAYDLEYGHMYNVAWPFEHLVYVEMTPEQAVGHEHKMENVNGKLFYFILRKNVELMQYIGLKDKHGTDICEGDIIQIEHARGPVVYGAPDFYVNYPDQFHEDWNLFLHHKKMEVIGNIYEHKHLLEGESA